MRSRFLLGLALLMGFMGSTPALVFESFCTSEQGWDFLDFTGEGKVYPTTDHSCPPGYGPAVLHVEGGAVIGMPKGVTLSEGTFLALYRENDVRDADSDGVIMVRAQYGSDVAVEHNVKTRRRHVWLEQDNDTGFQFKVSNEKGDESTIAERAGYGLVTDPWNVSRWIWQKVRVSGNRLQAKYWPAQEPEPEGWGLEADYNEPGDRFGIRINSGNISLAYYAADRDDIKRPVPPAYLLFEQLRATRLNNVVLTLFTNAAQASDEILTVTVKSGDVIFGRTEFGVAIPAGHSALGLLLSTDAAPAANLGHAVALEKEPGAGLCVVSIASKSGTFAAERMIEVVPVGEMEKHFADLAARVDQLDQALQKANVETPKAASLKVIRDAARAHLGYAEQQYHAGNVDKAELSVRFADEALAELSGYKGAWLRELAPEIEIPAASKQEDRRGIGAPPKEGISDMYSNAYRIRFGKPKLDAQSMVMGQSYEAVIPWTVEGSSPDRDFAFHTALVSPLGNRTPAQSDTPPDVPTHEWKPGDVYEQRVALKIFPEDPGGGTRIAEPVVLDEYHRLLISVVDSKTGAHLLLGNAPGPQPDRVGHSFFVEDVYISSAPIEVRGFDPAETLVLAARTDRAALRNVGKDAVDATAVFTVSTETKRVVHQQAVAGRVEPGADLPLAFVWTPNTAGNLTLLLRVMRDGAVLTEAKRTIVVQPPTGYDLRVEKSNHVAEGLVTPITVHAGKGPFSVEVRAGNDVVGPAKATESDVTVNARPWFGYYDVFVNLGAFRYDRRIVATVVETKDTDLLVNGESFIVKGTNVHGMDPGSPERTASMMRLMRDLGFNTWRGDYPALWQLDLAYELNTAYTVLVPYSCTSTADIFARQDGPPMTTTREITHLFAERYKDSAGVLLWNSCNEIDAENVDFLLSQYPVYKALDPYRRPVHYANLYGQDYWQGQDLMGTNCYFGSGQTAESRHPIVERTLEIARNAHVPLIYCEFNSFVGAIHSTGVDAMRGLFAWGVDQGMAGGFQYMKGDSTSHPGIFDGGFNTHKIYNEAIIKAFADAEVSLLAATRDSVRLRVANKRRCTLRQMTLSPTISGVAFDPIALADLAPKATADVEIPLPKDLPGPALTIQGHLDFTTHFGFHCHVPVSLVAMP